MGPDAANGSSSSSESRRFRGKVWYRDDEAEPNGMTRDDWADSVRGLEAERTSAGIVLRSLAVELSLGWSEAGLMGDL